MSLVFSEVHASACLNRDLRTFSKLLLPKCGNCSATFSILSSSAMPYEMSWLAPYRWVQACCNTSCSRDERLRCRLNMVTLAPSIPSFFTYCLATLTHNPFKQPGCAGSPSHTTLCIHELTADYMSLHTAIILVGSCRNHRCLS